MREGTYPHWADVVLFWAGFILRLEGVRGACWRREPPCRPRAHPVCLAHSGRVALFRWDPHPLSALSAGHPADIDISAPGCLALVPLSRRDLTDPSR